MAHPERFELPTKWFEATYSIQLSYGCGNWFIYFAASLSRTLSTSRRDRFAPVLALTLRVASCRSLSEIDPVNFRERFLAPGNRFRRPGACGKGAHSTRF